MFAGEHASSASWRALLRGLRLRLVVLRAEGLAVGLLVLLCVMGAGVSFGARGHSSEVEHAFGGVGAPVGAAGSLSLVGEPEEASPGSWGALDTSSHDVFVADTGNRRVSEFNAAGGFVRAWGWGVLNGAEELQVCEEHCLPGLSGSHPGEFETPSYIAVDNDPESASHGDVYVADTANHIVTKFTSAGALVSTWGTGGQLQGSPTEEFNSGFPGIPIEGVAVDGAGNLWVYNESSRLFEFAADGSSPTTATIRTAAGPGGGGKEGNATGQSGGSLLVHDGNKQVQQFDPQLVNTGTVTSGEQMAQGFDIDTSDGDVYVVRGRPLVEDIPGECAVVAPPTGGCSASQVFGELVGKGASAHGIVDGGALAVDSLSGTVYVSDAGSDTIDVFPAVIEALAGTASNVEAHSAVLHGSVDPFGAKLSSCLFVYGTARGELTLTVPCSESFVSIGEGTAPVSVEALVTGLDGGTTYYYRVRAVNNNGGISSGVGKLTTSVTPVVREVKTSELSGTGATLQAVVNPASASLAAHYHFEYGVCLGGACEGAPYATVVPKPDGEISAGTSDVQVSQTVTGLTAGLTYHFRIAVGNANGETSSTPEGVFVFEPAGPACSLPRPELDGGLDDCREYEMVTPADKNGALISNGVF